MFVFTSVYLRLMNRKYKPDLQAAVTLIFPRLSGRAKIQSCVGSARLGRHGGEGEKKKKICANDFNIEMLRLCEIKQTAEHRRTL